MWMEFCSKVLSLLSALEAAIEFKTSERPPYAVTIWLE